MTDDLTPEERDEWDRFRGEVLRRVADEAMMRLETMWVLGE